MYADNTNITAAPTRRRIIEVTNDWMYEDRSFQRRCKTQSRREDLTGHFHSIQHSLDRFGSHDAFDDDFTVLVMAFVHAQLPREFDVIESWISRGQNLLKQARSRVREHDQRLVKERERREQIEAKEREHQHWCNRLERFQSELDRLQRLRDWEGIVALHYMAHELYKRGLEQVETLAAIDAIQRELELEQAELDFVDECGDWDSYLFDGAASNHRSNADLGRYYRFRYGHRNGYDPDQRRTWRHEHRRLNSRWGV